MILKIYTLIHVLISLTGILSGLVVLSGQFTAKWAVGWTQLFLVTTVLTSVTGFFFPFHGFTPALATGIISLVVLALAIYARFARGLNGGWGKTYVASAILALYLNVFVLFVQSFLKIPALKALAPTQTEPPFKLTQLVVLVIFLAAGIFTVIRFKTKRS